MNINKRFQQAREAMKEAEQTKDGETAIECLALAIKNLQMIKEVLEA